MKTLPTPVETTLPLARSRIADYVELTKPRIAVLVLFTVAIGGWLAGLADGEDGALARFQRFAVSGRFGARQHETLRIQSHARPGEPIGVGLFSHGEDKDITCICPLI